MLDFAAAAFVQVRFVQEKHAFIHSGGRGFFLVFGACSFFVAPNSGLAQRFCRVSVAFLSTTTDRLLERKPSAYVPELASCGT